MPAVLVVPVAITLDNINVPIDDELVSADDVCRGLEQQCKAAGSADSPRSAGAEQVFEGELVEVDEAVARSPAAVRVEVLEGGAVGEQVVDRLTGGQRRLRELGDLARGERLLHLGIGPERRRPLLQQQVRAHVRRGRRPHTVMSSVRSGL